MAAPEAQKVSLLLPDVPLRTLDALSSGPTSPDHSTVAEVRDLLAKYRSGRASCRRFGARHSSSAKICLSRPATRAGGRRSFPKCRGRRLRIARMMTGGRHHERRRAGVSRFGFRNSAFKPRPGGKCAGAGARRPAISWSWTTVATTGTMPMRRAICWNGSMRCGRRMSGFA